MLFGIQGIMLVKNDRDFKEKLRKIAHSETHTYDIQVHVYFLYVVLHILRYTNLLKIYFIIYYI